MIPTWRTYGLLLIGGSISAIVYGLAAGEGRLLLALAGLLIFDGAVVLAMLADSWQARRAKVTVLRRPLDKLSIGRDNPIVLALQAKQPSKIEIYDHYPADFEGPEMPLQTTLSANADTDETITYEVKPLERGEYDWEGITLRQRGPWGLAWTQWSVSEKAKAAVYPDLLGLKQLSVKLALQSTGSLSQKRRLGVGTEFAELRDYDVGDDPRFIDWKATARRSQPLVRVLEPEREQTLLVLLDRGRLMTAQTEGLARFDWGMNAALSLSLAALSRGDRVGMGVFDKTLHTWLPPKRGQSHLGYMIEKLTPIQPELVESDYLSAVTQVVRQQQRRSLVVVITDLIDKTASSELLSALTRLRPRHLPFCIALRDPYMDQQVAAYESTVAGAYEKAVAIDLIAQREAAFLQLKQSGVLVLDSSGSALSDAVVERYLRIKARSLL